jgi:hypothetical protein
VLQDTAGERDGEERAGARDRGVDAGRLPARSNSTEVRTSVVNGAIARLMPNASNRMLGKMSPNGAFGPIQPTACPWPTLSTAVKGAFWRASRRQRWI